MRDHHFDHEFAQEVRCMFDSCTDSECMFCKTDDGEAAFWDEFFSDSEDSIDNTTEYFLSVVDEASGKEVSLDNLNIESHTILKLD